IDGAVARVRALGSVGIKSIVNGPIAHTPDEYPLLGPAPGLQNYWLAEGFTAGIMSAGGAGPYLAEWMVARGAAIGIWPVDPRRYGQHVGKTYTILKNQETYGHIFDIHYPNLEMPEARPSKASPCYDRLDSVGAVWGQTAGWERANWFAPKGETQEETLTF